MEFTDVMLDGRILAVSLGIGIVLGILLDIYSLIRNATRPGPVVTWIGDIAFWILFAFITFSVYYWCYWGQIRAYNIAAHLLGLFIYKTLLSRRFIVLFVKIGRVILWPYRALQRFYLWPFLIFKKLKL
ncbi:MAG: hypothetical protein HPY70_08590 [Firmicutes bacterium]|jgi:spore cortex biosynthesis protein YabQ|nr:hypothetical protein [Bacillota bacterium]